jgi:hypothetical protein
MYKFPASPAEALVHARAYSNGFRTPFSRKPGSNKIEPTQVCPCCENFVNTKDIPPFYRSYPKEITKEEVEAASEKVEFGMIHNLKAISSDHVFQVQCGDALFFCFVKFLIMLMMLRFFILDAYNLYSNSQGHYCLQSAQVQSTTVCVTPWIDNLSTPNKNTPEDSHFFLTGDILNLLFTFVCLFFFIYGRIKLFQLYSMLESWDITEDDYTILVEDIPRIPYEGSDARIKDVNKEYQAFIRRQIERKIRVWLNSFYNYDENQEEIEDDLSHRFYEDIYKDYA